MGTAAPSQDPLIGEIVGGRYEIVRLIGKGGMGAIYEVRNTRLGRAFALKVLRGDAAHDDGMLARFRREADVIARLKHPNIVEVIDWEELADGSPAMVLEYLRGEDLGRRIQGRPMPWPDLAVFADQMLAALSVAHGHGIVHRDLKPQNVFLAADDAGEERVKLLDFGISKIRDSQSLVTTDARLLGTPAYMAPEQAQGKLDEIGTHTDVWAMGTILQEMATGELAFLAPSLPAILYQICHGAPSPIVERRPDAPPAFVDLVGQALAPAIDQRIGDATVLRRRLREALRDVAGARLSDLTPIPSRPSSSGRAKRVTGALLATAAHTPVAHPPIETPALRSASSTLSVTPATPSLIARRRWAPYAALVAVAAAVVVVMTVLVATRDRTSTAPSQLPRLLTTPRPADDEEPIPIGRTGSAPTIDAAIDASTAALVDAPPGAEPRATSPRPRRGGIKPAPGSAGSATPTSPAVEPPRVPPPKKQCAKDDVECLYGDGT